MATKPLENQWSKNKLFTKCWNTKNRSQKPETVWATPVVSQGVFLFILSLMWATLQNEVNIQICYKFRLPEIGLVSDYQRTRLLVLSDNSAGGFAVSIQLQNAFSIQLQNAFISSLILFQKFPGWMTSLQVLLRSQWATTQILRKYLLTPPPPFLFSPPPFPSQSSHPPEMQFP